MKKPDEGIKIPIQLRKYQADSVNMVRDQIRLGKKKVVLVSPTGSGKSFIVADIASRSAENGHKVLILTHMRGLVLQMADRLGEYGLESAFIMAGHPMDLSKQIQVGTIQTYHTRLKLDYRVDASVVIIDEAHRSMSKTFQDVLTQYSDQVIVGVTATPVLSSGIGLGNFYNALVAPVSVQELIDSKDLMPCRYYAPEAPDLSKIKTVAGDYHKTQLGEKMNTPTLIGDVFLNWSKIAGGKQTMIFAVNVKHSKAIRDVFNRNGVVTEHLDAHSEDDERDAVISRFKKGETQVLTNVGLFTEGTDIPEIEAIVLARPTKSMGLYRQMVGRGLRPFGEKVECIVIDHGGCVERLGFIEDDIEWSLGGKDLKYKNAVKNKKEKVIIPCEMCLTVFSAEKCPCCGWPVPDYGKMVEALDAELVEVNKDKKKYTMEDKKRWFAMFEYKRREKGFASGWSAHKYRELFGCWPKGIKNQAPLKPNLEFNNYMKYLAIKWSKSQKRISK